jgi:hypothetical protein
MNLAVTLGIFLELFNLMVWLVFLDKLNPDHAVSNFIESSLSL